MTVYTYDEKGKYTIPVRAMICSTGLDNSTITGDYTIGIKTEWLSLVGDVSEDTSAEFRAIIFSTPFPTTQ